MFEELIHFLERSKFFLTLRDKRRKFAFGAFKSTEMADFPAFWTVKVRIELLHVCGRWQGG